MNILFIKKLIIKTIIGVYKWEKIIKQKLIFDLYISINNKNKFTDELSNCVDYTNIIKIVSHYVKNNKFNLIESVAENVALLLLNNFSLNWVKIKVVKPKLFLISNVRVGVIIKRKSK